MSVWHQQDGEEAAQNVPCQRRKLLHTLLSSELRILVAKSLLLAFTASREMSGVIVAYQGAVQQG